MKRSFSAALVVAASLLAYASNSAVAANTVIFDDMEHGDPLNNGWFFVSSSRANGGIGPVNTDPAPDGGVYSLGTGWGGFGAGFYGTFGLTSPTDLTGIDGFEFWINPDAGQDYTLGVVFTEDDNGDGLLTTAADDAFRFDCAIGQNGPCAVSGAGWQKVTISFSSLFDDNSFFFGGNGIFDATAPANGGNGELIDVRFLIDSNGSNVEFRTDNWAFTTSVPVPAGVWLFGSGIAALIGVRKNSRQK